MKTIKRSNKVLEALALPTLCNLNPRSLYNKINEFQEFVVSEDVDVVFLSETWERQNKTLSEIINLEDYAVISNVNQRDVVGGRPALVVNNKKFNVRNITNTLVPVMWGVEAVWAIVSPKIFNQASKIQHIACAAIYSKPGSQHKTDLLNHISDAFNIVSTKFGRGVHFIIAGDTNELRLKPIIDLSPNLVQIVKSPTRIDKTTGKESMLDPIITTLSKYYQEAQVLQPLDSDPGKKGKPSDHKIVKVLPISSFQNQSARVTRRVEVQPLLDSGLSTMKNWLVGEKWESVLNAKTANEKVEVFENIFKEKYNEFFPKKTIKVAGDDQPWFTPKLKDLDRIRKRIYHKQRRSPKWKALDKEFKKKVKLAKQNFYKTIVADLKEKNPKQWYSVVKRLASYEDKSKGANIESINHLPSQQQCDLIANEFANIPNSYNPLHTSDIYIPNFTENEIPVFTEAQVWRKLAKLKTKRSSQKGDVPSKLFKIFAAYLAEPLVNIFNSCIRTGYYPELWKHEIVTPIPKTFPTLNITDVRNISGLKNCDKIFESLLAELIMSDIQAKMDPAQFGNTKGTSINHYLIKMINRILTALDKNSRREKFAVVANLIDWNKAFPRQCPKLGVQSFIKNGV